MLKKLLFFCLIISYSKCDKNFKETDQIIFQNEFDEKYSSDKIVFKDWMIVPDGEGTPCYVQLKYAPDEDDDDDDDSGEHKHDEDFYHRHEMQFILYTKDKPDGCSVITVNNDNPFILNNLTAIDQCFNENYETKVIIHGWRSDGNSSVSQNMKNAYLSSAENYNVIVIDWRNMAKSLFYFTPVKNTKIVGKHVANFIDYLVKKKMTNIDLIHVIGHSLGAHASGYVGLYVTSGKLGRITGLDPAFPGFKNYVGIDFHLDTTDAQFVDIIHTCSGILGHIDRLGHVDFYPNGGISHQPGCVGILESIAHSCSHQRSYEFFTESINSQSGFYSFKCDTWRQFSEDNCNQNKTILMGEKTPHTARGVYLTYTNRETPFAKGIFKKQPKLGAKSQRNYIKMGLNKLFKH